MSLVLFCWFGYHTTVSDLWRGSQIPMYSSKHVCNEHCLLSFQDSFCVFFYQTIGKFCHLWLYITKQNKQNMERPSETYSSNIYSVVSPQWSRMISRLTILPYTKYFPIHVEWKKIFFLMTSLHSSMLLVKLLIKLRSFVGSKRWNNF